MSYWDHKKRVIAERTVGRPCVHPAYPAWVFNVRLLDQWNKAHSRSVLRLSQRPDIAAYLKRAADPDYQPTAADAELDAAMQMEAFAEGCMSGWNVANEEGLPIEFTLRNAVQFLGMFEDDIYPHLVTFATDARNFTPRSPAEVEKVLAGN